MFLVCQNDSIRILPQFGSVKFFYIIKSMKLTKLGCYLLVFRANLRAFSYIFTSNNIYNGHMCVWESHLEPRKKLIFLPPNRPCIGQWPFLFYRFALSLEWVIDLVDKSYLASCGIGNPSRVQWICGGGLPLAMHFNETLGPGWSVCSENLYKRTGMASTI